VEGNEVADNLAKLALNNWNIDLNVDLTIDEIKAKILTFINSKWQTYFNNCTAGKFYRAIEPNVSNKIKYSNNCRRKEVIITRLRFGHCLLNKKLHKFNKHPTGLCSVWTRLSSTF
jgi:hypothetical protein